jgi:hypothetical protein
MLIFAALLWGAVVSAPAPDVPLSLWTSSGHPQGLDFGATMGISFGDYDGDGNVDVFACWSGNLWRNVGGTDWQLAQNLATLVPPTERRYGASFGDYDEDGLPDIAMAPRVPAWGDDRFHLLHADGQGSFADVASNPALVDVQPYGNAETLCWADVDGDADLDLFVPVYPSQGGPGNFFLWNQGPAPDGTYRFIEASAPAGLDNPPGTPRPEGAQFVDVNGDGAVDLFANGTLYRNASSLGTPLFLPLDETASGIGLRESLDEGAAFFDYDNDGDFDLAVSYVTEGIRIWENRGDGTFFAAEPGIVDSPMTGLNLGLSAEDWDNDGDVDFTTRGVFRRNMRIEAGTRHFTVASTTIPSVDRSSATPAWADWDRDGDLDCALGNWGSTGKLYENTTYTGSTLAALKHFLRVRPVRDSRRVARGLETEYGAKVRIQPASRSSVVLEKFVASAHGYLNQNEYTLHFGLPEAGAVDIAVDFPGLASDGVWRVDKSVNPALGGLDPATLGDREITVTRCGDVVVDGVRHEPVPLAPPRLSSTASSADAGPPAPIQPAPGGYYTGVDFDTLGARGPLALREIVLDGQLDRADACAAGARNIALWDVTDAEHPIAVDDATLDGTTSPRNRRSTFHVSFLLAAQRVYRLVARVTELRPLPVVAGAQGLTVRGGFSFAGDAGCSGASVTAAAVDPDSTALSFRFAPVPSDTRLDPLADTLRVTRAAGGGSVLDWKDSGAASYSIRRCAASGASCTPDEIAAVPTASYADPLVPGPGQVFWYVVKATNGCTARP